MRPERPMHEASPATTDGMRKAEGSCRANAATLRCKATMRARSIMRRPNAAIVGVHPIAASPSQRQLSMLFTQDWFTHNVPNWEPVLHRLKGRPSEILEIGSYEGRSAVFLMQFLPHCRITCVDP